MTIKTVSISTRTYVGEFIRLPPPARIYCSGLDSSYQLSPHCRKGNELEHRCKVRFTIDHTGKAKIAQVLD